MHYFFTLLCYHASKCFGPICSPSLEGQVYNVAYGTCFTFKNPLGAVGLSSRPTALIVTLKVKQVPLPHYTLGLLMMGYKQARNMQRCGNVIN
jgi:hypothetical protein